MPRRIEAPMENQVETETVQPTSKIASVNRCVHGRLIDDVLTGNGQRCGKVRCLECGAQFDDMDYRTR
jgi:hypothetical protein